MFQIVLMPCHSHFSFQKTHIRHSSRFPCTTNTCLLSCQKKLYCPAVIPNPELVLADDDPRHLAGLLIVDQNMGFVLVNHACLLVEFVCLCIQNDIPESSNRRKYHQKHSKNNTDLKIWRTQVS